MPEKLGGFCVGGSFTVASKCPLVIQESLAIRIPVMASSSARLADAVTDEVNGLLFERGNEDELARLFQRIIAEPIYGEQISKTSNY